MIKKIILGLNLLFLKTVNRLSYNYYLKHFPLYLRKRGINFSGDIGKTGFISSDVDFDSLIYSKYITIGEKTIISKNVMFLVHDYSIGSAMRALECDGVKDGHLPHFIKDIKIGNNTFIGARSVILPGTQIGNNCIIGAGAVVKGIIPDNSIVIGNPAKVVQTTDEFVRRHLEKNDFIN